MLRTLQLFRSAQALWALPWKRFGSSCPLWPQYSLHLPDSQDRLSQMQLRCSIRSAAAVFANHLQAQYTFCVAVLIEALMDLAAFQSPMSRFVKDELPRPPQPSAQWWKSALSLKRNPRPSASGQTVCGSLEVGLGLPSGPRSSRPRLHLAGRENFPQSTSPCQSAIP